MRPGCKRRRARGPSFLAGRQDLVRGVCEKLGHGAGRDRGALWAEPICFHFGLVPLVVEAVCVGAHVVPGRVSRVIFSFQVLFCAGVPC